MKEYVDQIISRLNVWKYGNARVGIITEQLPLEEAEKFWADKAYDQLDQWIWSSWTNALI